MKYIHKIDFGFIYDDMMNNYLAKKHCGLQSTMSMGRFSYHFIARKNTEWLPVLNKMLNQFLQLKDGRNRVLELEKK